MTAALEWGEGSAARPGRTLPPGKTRYPFYKRLGGSQGQCGRAENLVPTGIRSPDRPARSQSLYRLSYPAHMQIQYHILFDDTASSISIHFRRTVLPFKSMRQQSEIHNTNFSKMNCAVETKLFGISPSRYNAFTWCNIQRYGVLTMVYNSQSPLFGPYPSSNFKTL